MEIIGSASKRRLDDDREPVGAEIRRAMLRHMLIARGIDEEAGDVTRFESRHGSSRPGNLALGAIDDPDLTRSVGHAVGAELAGLGITLALAPLNLGKPSRFGKEGRRGGRRRRRW